MAESVRINAWLAKALGKSRRDCDELITEGRVIVNGRPAERNDRIGPSDVVTLNGKPLNAPAKTYLALNKPPGYITAVTDYRSRTVTALLPPRYKKLFPVGRLDRETRGLLLFTNDGEWAANILHPSRKVSKIYQVTLDKAPDLALIQGGAMLQDGPSRFDSVRPVGPRGIEVVLHEGRKRQIRLTLQSLGYHVIDLVRTGIGGIKLGSLAEGEIRELKWDEAKKAVE